MFVLLGFGFDFVCFVWFWFVIGVCLVGFVVCLFRVWLICLCLFYCVRLCWFV